MKLDRARSWPPYHMLEDGIEARARAQLDKLERLYHIGQDNIWDGRQVLGDLIAKHGPPRIPAEKKEAALKMLSVLLWGELAAWAISADLAERIDDVEAKMAATSQAHDEARHFYVFRDYLVATGEKVPRLGGIGRRLLLTILETDSLVHKLLGMQLLVESNALGIFRGMAEAEIEPVLTELLPYYEKDEARHVGLGVMYLPKLLTRLSRWEAASAIAFQLRIVGMLMTAGMPMRADLKALGMNPRKMAEYTTDLQADIVKQMFAAARGQATGDRPARVKGIMNPGKGYGPQILDFIHPPDPAKMASWHKTTLRLWTEAARYADRALA